ncbi:MAG TPA: hypothetical protein VN704_08255 [Verrucomicrobiae bacterium]|nr:hypothetical protein [Verrucomicrobiae bacterium]
MFSDILLKDFAVAMDHSLSHRSIKTTVQTVILSINNKFSILIVVNTTEPFLIVKNPVVLEYEWIYPLIQDIFL